MKIRIFGTAMDSIVDGPGIRFAVFTQGCPHHCEGCHNPESHDFSGGREETTDALIAQMLENPLLDGLTLSGGDPLCQPDACAELARAAHAAHMNVWCYTGWTWEALMQQADPAVLALLQEVDVLVDGPFVLAQRSLELTFCGSRNQRLIDVPKSLAAGEIVRWQPKKW
ncbi:MAG: anaerobic ribonucleoside-triphosphate reductase activating protein [Clostridia bacterium]|nr:anaerobic ribonucleoside-triphosphate reductase activating protein [Clostridia bacterium]